MSKVQPSPDELQPGTRVGEYVVERKLGEGGMGQVYAGKHPEIGKLVAIKVLAAALVDVEQIALRMKEEARAVNQIRHPHIVDIFSFGTLPDRRPYFVMEYLEGENLADALARNTVTRADLVRLMQQLCEALGAAHAVQIIHRDLKPENLWVERRPGRPCALKVLDFGIAKTISNPKSEPGEQPGIAPQLTGVGQVLGTPTYMSPEQALAEPIDPRSDIYSLGVVLYRIFAGVLPFPDNGDETPVSIATKHVTQPPAPVSSHQPVPAALERIVLQCLAKQPAARPQTTKDLWAALGPAMEEWASQGPPRMTAPQPAVDPFIGTDRTQLAPTPTALQPATEPPRQSTRLISDQDRAENAAENGASTSRMTIQPVPKTIKTEPSDGRGRSWPVFVIAGALLAGGAAWWMFGARKPVVSVSPTPVHHTEPPSPAPAEVVVPVAPAKPAAGPAAASAPVVAPRALLPAAVDAGSAPSAPKRKPKKHSDDEQGTIRLL